MTIYFDMDGTLVDTYAVEGWLNDLRDFNTRPYEQGEVMLNMRSLARLLNILQKRGFKIGIISWCSKTGTEEFNHRTEKAKRKWLATHLRSVAFDEIIIAPYGTPKHELAPPNSILFDDEARNRTEWNKSGNNRMAFSERDILETLRELIR